MVRIHLPLPKLNQSERVRLILSCHMAFGLVIFMWWKNLNRPWCYEMMCSPGGLLHFYTQVTAALPDIEQSGYLCLTIKKIHYCFLIICAWGIPSSAHFSLKAAAMLFGTLTAMRSYTFLLYRAFTWVDVVVFRFSVLTVNPPWLPYYIYNN